MNVDKHILFLIVIIGIISAGLVGATVFTSDSSMKQEVFDGMTVSVPADSEFVKTGDGVYKDANNGITIHTFKDNNSMIGYLKNTKKSKIIPVDNQPPQSVAFKKGDKISILVTNGQEGLSVTSKDGELTSQIANSIIFSNNHKSEKSTGLGMSKAPMNVKQDFNLIFLLIAEVDTKIFNTAIFEENIVMFVDDYNDDIGYVPSDDELEEDDSGDYVSDIEDSDDLNNVLSDNNDSSSDDSAPDSEVAEATPADEPADEPADDSIAETTPADDNDASSNDDAASGEPEELTIDECREIVETDIPDNMMLGPDFSIDHDSEEDGYYVFFIKDIDNNIVGNYTVDPLTGEFEYFDMLEMDAPY